MLWRQQAITLSAHSKLSLSLSLCLSGVPSAYRRNIIWTVDIILQTAQTPCLLHANCDLFFCLIFFLNVQTTQCY